MAYLDRDVPAGPSWRAQLLTRGWGYVTYDPTSVQADTGGALDRGVIGLTNKGMPRKAGDWGALRAWAWGISRIVDYLQTRPDIAGNKIGVEGHSRFGKASLVAMAYDPRIVIGYISSSGAGGAKLLKRNFGETLEDLASAHEFHWFAGEFLKYAADPLTVYDLPVDADALIALVAPRPIFISAGSETAGDAWIDPRGSFIAAVSAGPVYRLLGEEGLETDNFPSLGEKLVRGNIGFQQHQYDHTDTPTWPTFLEFAERHFSVSAQ